jgi:hypothetical protein
MHPTILVQRRAKALNRIFEKADALIKHLDLSPALTEALQPRGAKDPQVIEMFRLEALADLFDQLAESAGVPKSAAVTAVTDEGEAESKPAEETIPGPVPFTEGLPPPVLEDEAPAAQEEEPGSSASKAEAPAEPVGTESTIEEASAEDVAALEPEAAREEVPAQEELIIEEPMVAPKTPRRKSKSSNKK